MNKTTGEKKYNPRIKFENPVYRTVISAKTKIMKANIKIIYFFKKFRFLSFLYNNKNEAIIEIKGIYKGIPIRLERFSTTICLLFFTKHFSALRSLKHSKRLSEEIS